LKITIFSGKIHYKWPFSIATLNYQRVSIEHTAPACGAKLRDGPTAEQASLLAGGALEAQGNEGMGGDRKYPLVISNSYPLVICYIAIENGHL